MAKKKEKNERDYMHEVEVMLEKKDEAVYEKCLEEADRKLRPYIDSVHASQQLSSSDFSIYINTLD